MNCGIDIYYDKYDQKLANAIKNINAEEVTNAIEEGISKSTHLLCIVSEKTVYSWWVPYEVGYAKKSRTIKIATLKHKNTTLPQFLKITEILKGISDLDEYLIRINGVLNESNSLYSRKYSFESSELGKYLDR